MEGTNLNKNSKEFWLTALSKTLKRDVPLIALLFFLMGVITISCIAIKNQFLSVVVILFSIVVAYGAYGKRTQHENLRRMTLHSRKTYNKIFKLSPFIEEGE